MIFVSTEKWKILAWIIAPILLFLPLPVIGRLAFFGNSDALFYSNVLSFTSDALLQAKLFPRWISDANAGFGSPVMMFYAPLSYIITALINVPLLPLKLDIGTQLLIGIYFSQIASGITSYLWLKRSFVSRVAFLGSLAFVLLPYKLIYIYIHINLAQLWALSFLPLWMMAAEDMVHRSRRREVAFYAFIAACVYYTHPLTFIAFGAVPLMYVIWFGRRSFKAMVISLSAAHVLIVLIGCMQLLPEYFFTPWIHAERFLQGNYNWRRNFFHVDVVLCAYYGIIALLLVVCLYRVPALRNNRIAAQGWFWIIIIASILFLTQRISAWVWDIITPLQYLQFPAARLHAAALMAVTYLICIWLGNFKELRLFSNLLTHPACLALLVGFFGMVTLWHVYKIESDPLGASESYMVEGRAAKLVSTPVPIYETVWGCISPKKAYQLYDQGKVPPQVVISNGNAKVSMVTWQPPDRIAVDVNALSEQTILHVRQCYFPLWQARDEYGSPLRLYPDASTGIINIDLSEGMHHMVISMPRSPVELVSWVISLSTLIAVLLLMVPFRIFPAVIHNDKVDFS